MALKSKYLLLNYSDILSRIKSELESLILYMRIYTNRVIHLCAAVIPTTVIHKIVINQRVRFNCMSILLYFSVG